MPGFLHSVTVRMFRNSGELARVLAGLAVPLPQQQLVPTAVSGDLSEPQPVEYRADQVTAYRRRGRDKPELAIIVEVQRRVDLRKRWTWLSYVANAAADHQCRVLLLVVTWSGRVARWARGPFLSGHPGFDLAPMVVDLSKLPALLPDTASARHIPEVAVLCALASRDAPSAKAAISTLRGLPSDRVSLYLQTIASALPPSEALILEKQMQSSEDWSFFYKKFPNLTAKLGRPFEARGQARGRRQGKAEGRAEGVAAAQRAALTMLAAKLGKVSPADAAVVRAIQDVDRLLALLVQLGLAGDAKQVRAVLARRPRVAARARRS